MRDEILAVEAEMSITEVLVDAADASVKGRLIVVGLPDQDLMAALEAEWETERDYFGNHRPKRVGFIGGLVQAGLSALHVNRSWNNYYGVNETYFDYRQRLRDEEVYHQTRRPPKKAICSTRRRGRKFKG